MHFSASNLQTDASHFHTVYLLRVWRVKALMPAFTRTKCHLVIQLPPSLVDLSEMAHIKHSIKQDIAKVALQARRRNISSKNCMRTQVTEIFELASQPMLLSPPGCGLP